MSPVCIYNVHVVSRKVSITTYKAHFVYPRKLRVTIMDKLNLKSKTYTLKFLSSEMMLKRVTCTFVVSTNSLDKAPNHIIGFVSILDAGLAKQSAITVFVWDLDDKTLFQN